MEKFYFSKNITVHCSKSKTNKITNFLPTVIFLNCRLVYNLEEDSEGSINFKDLVQAYNNYCSKCGILPASVDTIARLIIKLFPSIFKYRTEGRQCRTVLYKGIRFRRVPQPNVNSVTNITLPSFCSAYALEFNGLLQVDVPTEYLVNGKPLVYNILINKKNFRVKLHDEFISLDSLGIDSITQISQVHILSIIKILQSIELCKGKEQTTSEESKALRKETWVRICDPNYSETRFRAKRCEGVLPFTSMIHLCKRCSRSLTWTCKKLDKESSKGQ